MEWLDKMNEAIAYIEDHIKEKVDLSRAAQIACCSLSRFQRMFTFVTDVSIAEYIRCRKMSLAAGDLLGSDIKVMELSMKYGYESPEAFTRAFQAFHGFSPTTVRKLGTYTHYPRLSFKITINGGNVQMGTKPLVRMEEHSGGRVVTFFVDCRGPEEAAWNLLREWAVAQLSDYPARRYMGCAPKGHHPKGQEHRSDEGPGSHEYMAQMFLLEDEGKSDTFLGAPVCDAPKGLFLVGDVVMNEFQPDGSIDIGASMQRAFGVMAECLTDMGGYEFDLKERPYFEEHVFSKEWFSGEGDLAGFKLWLPIKKDLQRND